MLVADLNFTNLTSNTAWVMGASDPTSGTVSALEMIRGFSKLYRHGWKPLRTLVIGSWDAEEVSMIVLTALNTHLSYVSIVWPYRKH